MGLSTPFGVLGLKNLLSAFTIEYLIIGGGGGTGNPYGGAGGAGAYLTSTTGVVPKGASLTITVGTGGAAGSTSQGGHGTFSQLGDIYAMGGGGGGQGNTDAGLLNIGLRGGSGGGGGSAATPSNVATTSAGGVAIQSGAGFAGGLGGTDNWTFRAGGGGGGAGGVGGNSSTNTGGTGGAGLSSSITGTSVARGGGGGGRGFSTNAAASAGGGSGANGTANTGGGGGGDASSGGSGIVIIAYLTAIPALVSIGGGLTSSVDTAGRSGYRVYSFTAGTGTIVFP